MTTGLKLRKGPKLFGPPLWCCSQVLQGCTAQCLRGSVLGIEECVAEGGGTTVTVDWAASGTLVPVRNGSSCLVAACLSCVAAHRKLKDQLSWEVVLERLIRSTSILLGLREKLKSVLGLENPLLWPPPQEHVILINKKKFAATHGHLAEVEIPKGFVHVQWPSYNRVKQLVQRYPLIGAVTCNQSELDQVALQGQVYRGQYEPQLTRCVVIAGYDEHSWILMDAFGKAGLFRIPLEDTREAGICSFIMVPAM